MAKFLIMMILVSLRLLDSGHPSETTIVSSIKQIAPAQIELISFTGTIRDNKILLQWIIGRNETVDRFEIERSADKKNFSLAALVLCSEKKETDYYKYQDRPTGKKTFYRIKIINKDGSIRFSDSLELDPSAKPEPIEQTKTNSDAYYC